MTLAALPASGPQAPPQQAGMGTALTTQGIRAARDRRRPRHAARTYQNSAAAVRRRHGRARLVTHECAKLARTQDRAIAPGRPAMTVSSSGPSRRREAHHSPPPSDPTPHHKARLSYRGEYTKMVSTMRISEAGDQPGLAWPGPRTCSPNTQCVAARWPGRSSSRRIRWMSRCRAPSCSRTRLGRPHSRTRLG